MSTQLRSTELHSRKEAWLELLDHAFKAFVMFCLFGVSAAIGVIDDSLLTKAASVCVCTGCLYFVGKIGEQAVKWFRFLRGR